MHDGVVLGWVLLLVGQVGIIVALWQVLSLVALLQVGIVVSLACCGGSVSQQVLHAVIGWHCGSCAHWGGVVAGLGRVRVASQQVGVVVGLHAMLGWRWGGIMVGHVCHNGVKVAVDLHVAKGEEVVTTDSQVVRWRWQWGLATLRRHRVRDYLVERWKFEDLACGRKTTERLCNAS